MTYKGAEMSCSRAEMASNTAEITGLRAEMTCPPAELTSNTAEITGLRGEVTDNVDEIARQADDVTATSAEVTGKAAEITGLRGEVIDNVDEIARRADDVTAPSAEVTGKAVEITGLRGEVTDNVDEIARQADDVTAISAEVTGNTVEITRKTNEAIENGVERTDNTLPGNALADCVTRTIGRREATHARATGYIAPSVAACPAERATARTGVVHTGGRRTLTDALSRCSTPGTEQAGTAATPRQGRVHATLTASTAPSTPVKLDHHPAGAHSCSAVVSAVCFASCSRTPALLPSRVT
jgi:methyl-accepting chemotaxis protein